MIETLKEMLGRLIEHVENEILGYAAIGIMVAVIGGFVLMAKNIEPAEREPWCKTYIHLLTVLPDGRIIVPGKSGHWGDVDHYVDLEVKGSIVSVKTGNYNSRVTIIERRCGE